MTDRLLAWARSRGYLVAWGPLAALEPVRADLDDRRAAGEIEPAFARENLAFNFLVPGSANGHWRILVVAMPRAAHLVTFILGGRPVEAILPPTYVRYRPIFEDVRRDLATHALPGSTIELIEAPLKALASRLGLIRYGRNNLAYAPHFGSYMQLLGYATDANLAVDAAWRPKEPSLLEECGSCGVCEAVCPTGAIGSERVLLHAERCLTLANETAGAWPSWVPPSAHHCLIGCLRCQRLCPANPDLPEKDAGMTFSEEETGALLAGGERLGPVWDRIRDKLETLGQPYQEAVIGRNLRALLEARAAGEKVGRTTGSRAAAEPAQAE
jgi:epoxyqueuosine reductase